MFTGIVEDVGIVKEIERKGIDFFLRIEPKKIDVREIQLGESVAVNGACLTVMGLGEGTFDVEASHETLSKTNLSRLKVGSKVNLERSLALGERLGGHIVNGHIDGVGRVASVRKRGDSMEMWFSLNSELSRYVVEKGSIAIDGVSFTVNMVEGNKFSVNVIPYTQEATIFRELKTGSIVNVECDILGKYVEKFLLGKEAARDIRELVKKL